MAPKEGETEDKSPKQHGPLVPSGISPPPPGIEERSGGEQIRAVVLNRRGFNPQLLLAIPFCAALATLAVVGIRDGARRGSFGILLLALTAAAVVLLLAWPIASTLFGREVLTLEHNHLSWRRQIGSVGLTREVPLIALRGMSVQHLGVMAISPRDVGWCLVVATHRPYKPFLVGAGLMHDEETMTWLADHLRAGLESITSSD